MGKSESKQRSQSVLVQPTTLSKAYFPKLHSPKLLINILDCLYPHEIIAIQYTNTFIYDFLADDMIWMRLTTNNKRMLIGYSDKINLFYPESEFPVVRMPLKSVESLPLEFTPVESLEHKIFLMGGYHNLGAGHKQPVADVYEFLERKARVERKERLTEARYNFCWVARQNEIYILGGEDGNDHILYCERYIISDNMWISISFLLTPIVNGTVCSLGDFLYHIEPIAENSNKLLVNRYSCSSDHWEGKTIEMDEKSQIRKIGFGIGSTQNPNELLIFCDRALFSVETNSLKITNKSEEGKLEYPKDVEDEKWSYSKIGKTNKFLIVLGKIKFFK